MPVCMTCKQTQVVSGRQAALSSIFAISPVLFDQKAQSSQEHDEMCVNRAF